MREDVLDHAITQKLAELQPSEADCEQMEADWLATEAQQELEVQRRSLQLRLDECFARGERLTDLLVDGTITKEAFQSRSKKLALEKQDLTETLDKVPDLRGVQCVRTKFLELVSDLTGLYQCLEPDEKRILVHNVFSNCTVARKNIDFEPYDWLTKALRTLRASVGEERRHISRTAEHFEHIERGMEPLLELRQANEI